MKVLVGCEFSQLVTQAFRNKGHDAYSCDILDGEINPHWHFKCNVLDILNQKWDLGIFHPPCTYICNSGVRHLYNIDKSKNIQRWKLMDNACNFFIRLKTSSIPKICIENPIPHKYSKNIIGGYTQIIQPWQFGHGETKATCLWLKELPNLLPTQIVSGRVARIHKLGPSKNRSKLRSITYQGIANAMAEQWG